ncbi:MAG: DUF3560 domain-containing protein [Phaeodactylibacter sp.]|nr:DUF3560 domain-containing protein [Phaeodactylibacter sp.]
MNTYSKYAPNVFLAKCEEQHQRGDEITLTTKYGKENEHIVYNLIYERDGFYFYSIVRADGFDARERAKRKAEKYEEWAESAEKKSEEWYEKSREGADFLKLGEPIKVGHHSESRHRNLIDRNWRRMGRCVEFSDKAKDHRSKAEDWASREQDINLSMPDSLGYYEQKLEEATEYHAGLKSGKYKREHSNSLNYAKKAVNECKKKLDLAHELWS